MAGDMWCSQASVAGMQAAELPRQVQVYVGGGRRGHRQWVWAVGGCPRLVAAMWLAPLVDGWLQATDLWQRLAVGNSRPWRGHNGR